MKEGPFVCLHGFTGTPQAFSALDLEIAYAPYLTGHGPDPNFSSLSYDEEITRIAAGISARCKEPAHLLAYSMGARVALGIIEKHPELLRCATLIGVNPGLASEDERQERLGWEARWIDVLEQDGLAVFEHKWRHQPLFASQGSVPPRSQDAQRSARLSHTAPGLVHALHVLGLGSMPNFWPRLSNLLTPTALVYGALDQKFAELSQRAKQQNQCFRLKSLPHVGHNPLLEAPTQVRDFVLELESEDEDSR